MISVVIITKNEEQNLKVCLDKLSMWVDDIVIVDDYSEDNTIEIAKEYTSSVFLRKFDNFSAQRNYGVSQAKYDWVLSLDPDEEVSVGLKEEILGKVEKPN